MKKWAVMLLCIYLIAVGTISILDLSFNGLDVLLPLLGIVAGVFLIIAGKVLFHPVGVILLAIWLILNGAIAVFKLSFDNLPLIMAALALVTSVLIIIGAKKKKVMDWLGSLLLAVYLLILGLVGLLTLSFSGLPFVSAALAIAAGIFLLIQKK